MSNEFKLVPLVATLEMKAAGQAELERQDIPPAEMQTLWFAMLAAAPQPPALGGESIRAAAKKWFYESFDCDLLEKMEKHNLIAQAEGFSVSVMVDLELELEKAFSTHLDPLKAEIERHKANAEEWEKASLHWMAERDQLNARCLGLEGALIEIRKTSLSNKNPILQVIAMREVAVAALSKPAGSEQV